MGSALSHLCPMLLLCALRPGLPRVAVLHGDKSQRDRARAIESFKSGRCPILVRTPLTLQRGQRDARQGVQARARACVHEPACTAAAHSMCMLGRVGGHQVQAHGCTLGPLPHHLPARLLLIPLPVLGRGCASQGRQGRTGWLACGCGLATMTSVWTPVSFNLDAAQCK